MNDRSDEIILEHIDGDDVDVIVHRNPGRALVFHSALDADHIVKCDLCEVSRVKVWIQGRSYSLDAEAPA
jgi:hypothetical protein